MLRDADVLPLCKSPRPTGSDFTLRYTVFLFSSHGTYTYRGSHGRVLIDVLDRVYDPPARYQATGRIPSARLYELLKEAGLDGLWGAEDPDCMPDTVVNVEYGSVIEFQDALGYHVRSSPRVQFDHCHTPYASAFQDVKAVIDSLWDFPPAS